VTAPPDGGCFSKVLELSRRGSVMGRPLVACPW
jgi:hypothetical protein